MVTLDFSQCKTPEDVAKVYDENKLELKNVRQIKEMLEEDSER